MEFCFEIFFLFIRLHSFPKLWGFSLPFCSNVRISWTKPSVKRFCVLILHWYFNVFQKKKKNKNTKNPLEMKWALKRSSGSIRSHCRWKPLDIYSDYLLVNMRLNKSTLFNRWFGGKPAVASHFYFRPPSFFHTFTFHSEFIWWCFYFFEVFILDLFH